MEFECGFEWEPLRTPLGFKGGSLTGLWQTAVWLRGAGGCGGLGLGTQSTLWSDPELFASCSEEEGNRRMYAITREALARARALDFASPPALLDALLPALDAYAREVTGRPDLRLTFILNALVALDNAAWQLVAAEQGWRTFDDLIPEAARPALSCRHRELALIPLISYGMSPAAALAEVEQGAAVLKIKLGHDPAGDGDPEKMLAWDCRRLDELHAAVRDRQTPLTESGRVLYYLDANGRYDTRARLLRLLEHAAAIGAAERIVLLEEPFPEACMEPVGDLPVRVAADESAHSEREAAERMDLGYGAIALKPIAKTLSQSLRIAQQAHARGIPCFCADLTVNPILVDWNKNVAARLAPLPGLRVGVLESNGHQHYRDWERMRAFHPRADAPWTRIRNGCFPLGDDFYATAGGIFEPSAHYQELVHS